MLGRIQYLDDLTRRPSNRYFPSLLWLDYNYYVSIKVFTRGGIHLKDFEYIAPQTLREAVTILTAKGDQARARAGGTDLIVQMRVKRHQPACVVDIKNIPELNALSYGPRRGMTIGAATPCSKI